MCVHWLTGDGLRREDGLRASVPARGGGFIATDRSVVCVRCCCVRSFLPENDRERSRCVWLSPRAPRPRPCPRLGPRARRRAVPMRASTALASLTHRAEGGSLSRPVKRHRVIRTTYDIWAESCMPPLPGARTYMRQSPRLGLPGGRGRESEEESERGY